MGTRLATPDTAKKHQEHTVFRYFVSSIYRVKEKKNRRDHLWLDFSLTS